MLDYHTEICEEQVPESYSAHITGNGTVQIAPAGARYIKQAYVETNGNGSIHIDDGGTHPLYALEAAGIAFFDTPFSTTNTINLIVDGNVGQNESYANITYVPSSSVNTQCYRPLDVYSGFAIEALFVIFIIVVLGVVVNVSKK